MGGANAILLNMYCTYQFFGVPHHSLTYMYMLKVYRVSCIRTAGISVSIYSLHVCGPVWVPWVVTILHEQASCRQSIVANISFPVGASVL